MHERRRRPAHGAPLLVLVSAAFVLGLWSPGPASAAGALIVIADGVSPATVTVTPGATVTFRNDDGNRHRMRTTSGPEEFDSGDLDPGESFTVALGTIGTYQYRDERNKDLSNYFGTIVVAVSPGPTPTPGPGATPAPTPPPTTGVTVRMAGRVFSPATVTVDAGTVVTWLNDDGREHTVTANDRSFDSGLMPVGARFVRTFSTAGTFGYLCLIHPDMTGSITVRGAPGATPPPPTPAPTPRPTPPPSGANTILALDFAFSPTTVDIAAGTTITWRNDGAALHTVTATDGSYDSGIIAAGGTYVRRFSSAGTYLYLCGLHASMTGVIRVSGPGGATPPPPAPPTPAPTPVAAGADELELRDFAFVPSTIRVTPGTAVTWVNVGAAPHTVTDRVGRFDSGILARGERYRHVFAAAGTYQLLCAIHPEMAATLIVAAPGATAPPPPSPPAAPTPAAGGSDVSILDFSYSPDLITVPVGTTVTWTNVGVAPHTVTARDGTFDSGFLNTGEVFRRTFDAPGTVEILCAIHPAMLGTVVVTGPGDTAPPSPGPSGPADPAPPSAEPGASGGAGGGTGSGSGSGGAEQPPDSVGPPSAPGVDAILRGGLVALLGLGATASFAAVVRGTARRGTPGP